MTANPTDYDRCRTLGHSWDPFAPVGMRRPAFGTRISVRCVNCPTERHDLVSTIDGTLLARSYRYPDGYQFARGDDRPDRNTWRLIFLRKVRARRRRRAS